MKILKPVLSYIAILFCSIIIMGAIMFLLLGIVDNVVWLIWVSSGVIVAIATLFILLYVKNKKFNNFIKKHKNVFKSGSFSVPFGAFMAWTGIFHDHITNPILWNWIIGSVLVLFIILTIVYYTKYIKIKDDNLKLQIEPHTIRNIIEDMRLKLKIIASDMNNQVSCTQEENAVKSKINSLHYEMESTCDFLSEIAEDNAQGKNMIKLSDEYENVKRYLSFRTNNDLSNISLDKNYNDKDIDVPARITTPIIENAFKHGEVDAPDFLKVSFLKYGEVYAIEVRNRVLKSGMSLEKRGGLGISNLKQRVKLYNESYASYTATMQKAENDKYYYFKIIFEKRNI